MGMVELYDGYDGVYYYYGASAEMTPSYSSPVFDFSQE
jgi:hypothetical protein